MFMTFEEAKEIQLDTVQHLRSVCHFKQTTCKKSDIRTVIGGAMLIEDECATNPETGVSNDFYVDYANDIGYSVISVEGDDRACVLKMKQHSQSA